MNYRYAIIYKLQYNTILNNKSNNNEYYVK